MTHEQLVDLLKNEGFITGWVLAGVDLILWEHDEDPPKPLKRPND